MPTSLSLGPRCPRRTQPSGRRAFTLIEIMIVVAIMGIVMTIAIPSIYRQLNPESMRKTVQDIMDACSYARAHAILTGTEVVMVIRPGDRTIQVPNFTAQISSKVVIEMLDVNNFEFKDEEEARVHFQPNGVCDEFTLILHGDDDEWRKISLEVMTGLADVDSDRRNWR